MQRKRKSVAFLLEKNKTSVFHARRRALHLYALKTSRIVADKSRKCKSMTKLNAVCSN